jgi:hypothetical protein
MSIFHTRTRLFTHFSRKSGFAVEDGEEEEPEEEPEEEEAQEDDSDDEYE